MAALDDLTNAGLPVPSIYGSETGAADHAYQSTLAQIAQQQAQAAQHYGFAISTDPTTGALTNTRIDPSQQYSAVMNMLGSNSQALHGLRESLSGQGLTGGGLRGLAAQRAQLLQFQGQGQVAGLGQQFAQQYGGLENQKAGALDTRNQGYNQAAMDAINFAIQNGWFNQAAAVAQPSAGYGITDPGIAPTSPNDPNTSGGGDSAQQFMPTTGPDQTRSNFFNGAPAPSAPAGTTLYPQQSGVMPFPTEQQAGFRPNYGVTTGPVNPHLTPAQVTNPYGNQGGRNRY